MTQSRGSAIHSQLGKLHAQADLYVLTCNKDMISNNMYLTFLIYDRYTQTIFFFLEFFRIYNKNKISSYFKRKRKKSIIMQINCFKEIIPRISIFGIALNKLKTIDNQLNIWRRLTELLSAVHIALEIRETRTTRRSAFSVFEIYDKQCRRFTETVDRLVERD